jgi:hypothetical protein
MPSETVAICGKLHGLVELVNGLEQFCMRGRKIAFLNLLALARTAVRLQHLDALQTVQITHSGST